MAINGYASPDMACLSVGNCCCVGTFFSLSFSNRIVNFLELFYLRLIKIIQESKLKSGKIKLTNNEVTTYVICLTFVVVQKRSIQMF